MNFNRHCNICQKEKICSSDKKLSQFYTRKETKTNKGFYSWCIECHKNKTNEKREQKKQNDEITGDSFCLSIDTLISSVISKLHTNQQNINPDVLEKYAKRLQQLAYQKKIEDKVNETQSMYFAKKEIGYNSIADVARIKSDLAMRCMDMQKIVNTNNIYIFERKDKIRIIVDDDITFCDGDRLRIKNSLTKALNM